MTVRALVLTGYGLNCDYETDYSLRLAGFDSHRIHINDLINGDERDVLCSLNHYHLMVFGGGFSWADDHGAGVLLASKLKNNLHGELERFITSGKCIIGICNGFQSLVNLGLLPGFDFDYQERRVALTYNDSGNFIDTWVNLRIEPRSPCIFTKGVRHIELPVRHGEGKFYASEDDIDRLISEGQVVMQYADAQGKSAQGKWPQNPNGSLRDIAGICDPSGRIFGLMPHPEAFNHATNHPDWTRRKSVQPRRGQADQKEEGDGIQLFRNAVNYIELAMDRGEIEA
jgi:phosphoribosylformylglycinamidine synthase